MVVHRDKLRPAASINRRVDSTSECAERNGLDVVDQPVASLDQSSGAIEPLADSGVVQQPVASSELRKNHVVRKRSELGKGGVADISNDDNGIVEVLDEECDIGGKVVRSKRRPRRPAYLNLYVSNAYTGDGRCSVRTKRIGRKAYRIASHTTVIGVAITGVKQHPLSTMRILM